MMDLLLVPGSIVIPLNFSSLLSFSWSPRSMPCNFGMCDHVCRNCSTTISQKHWPPHPSSILWTSLLLRTLPQTILHHLLPSHPHPGLSCWPRPRNSQWKRGIEVVSISTLQVTPWSRPFCVWRSFYYLYSILNKPLPLSSNQKTFTTFWLSMLLPWCL